MKKLIILCLVLALWTTASAALTFEFVVTPEVGDAYIWDVKTGDLLNKFKSDVVLTYSIAFSPCNKYIVYGSDSEGILMKTENTTKNGANIMSR